MRAEAEHLVDQQLHKEQAVIAVEGLVADVRGRLGEEEVVHAPDPRNGVVEAGRDAAAEDGAHLDARIGARLGLALDDGDAQHLRRGGAEAGGEEGGHVAHGSVALAGAKMAGPIRSSGSTSRAAPSSIAARGIPKTTQLA